MVALAGRFPAIGETNDKLMPPARHSLLLSAIVASALFAAPTGAAAEARVQACNESQAPAGLAMRVFGVAWERETLAPGDCRHLRISGSNLLFDVATLGHGAKIRLEPEGGDDREFCEWKINFGAATWQRHAIRLEGSAIICVFQAAPELKAVPEGS